MLYKIRKRKKEDTKSIANIVTVSWKETYKGIVPDYFFKELENNEEQRAKNAYDSFDITNNNQLVLEVEDKVVGFVSYGPAKENDFENCGEIIALYIIKQYKGKGFGKKLVDNAKKELKKLGYNKMIIACLKGNPSNEFYKHIGGVYIKDAVFKRLNLPENVYYYENI